MTLGMTSIGELVRRIRLCLMSSNQSMRPRGVLLRGLSGSGKSTLCRAATRRMDECRIVALRPMDVVNAARRKRTLSSIAENENGRSVVVVLEDVEDICRCDRTRGQSDLFRFIDDVSGCSTTTCVLVTAGIATGDSSGGGERDGRAVLDLRRLADRLGQVMTVPSLSEAERKDVLVSLLRDVIVGSDRVASRVARATNGYVVRDLVRVCRSLALRLMTSTSSDTAMKSGQRLFDPSERDLSIHLMSCLRMIRPSQLRSLTVRIPAERWSDIGGYDEVKRRLTQLVTWRWTRLEEMKRMGVKPAKGILLHGPSGCGKGMIAHALAGECGVNFVVVKGTELFSKWLGDSERALRSVFARARASAPCLLFFDEIDSIATGRDLTGGGGGNAENGVAERMLSTLLNEMDGVGMSDRSEDDDDGTEVSSSLSIASSRRNDRPPPDVVIIAATNRVDMIDAAVLRPGRIDRMIHVRPPNEDERTSIFQVCTRNMPLAEDVSLETLSKKSHGMSGAQIADWCRRAGIASLRRNGADATSVSAADFIAAAGS